MNLKIYITYKSTFLILIILLTSVNVWGQRLRSFSQDFTYEDNGQKYQGSFRYEFFARTDREMMDLLKNPIINFKGKGKQIWIRIYKLRLDNNSSQAIKLFVQDDWIRYNKNQVQPYRSGREALVELDKRERFIAIGSSPQTIGFNVLEDGKSELKLGYYGGKTLENQKPAYLNFMFIAEGTGNKPTSVVEKPTPPIITPSVEVTPEQSVKKPEPIEPTPTIEKPIQPKELTAEEKAWEQAVSVGTMLSYQQFINAYPNHTLAAKAQTAIETLRAQSPIEVNIHQRDDLFVLRFYNAKNPRIAKIEPNDKVFSSSMGDSIEVQITEEKVYTITIEDDLGKTQTVEIDNSALPLSGKIKAENGVLIYEAKGGMPPYSLVFRDKNGITVNRLNLEGKSGKLPYKKLGGNLNGIYTINLFDTRKTMSKTFENITIQQQKGKTQFWLFVGLGLGIIGLAWGSWYFYQKVHANEFEEEF